MIDDGRGEAGTAPPSEPAAAAPTAETAPELAAAGSGDLTTITRRVAKMQKQLLQDSSELRQAAAELLLALPQGFDKLHGSFAMLAKNVVTSQVKADEGNIETRRLFSDHLDALGEKLAGVVQDRVVERVLLTAVADVVQDADAVISGADDEQRGSPAYDALRMVREKLIAAFRPFGVELIPIEVAKSPFDETLHECVRTDTEADVGGGVITEVYAHGYTMHGRTIRRAKVVVRGA